VAITTSLRYLYGKFKYEGIWTAVVVVKRLGVSLVLTSPGTNMIAFLSKMNLACNYFRSECELVAVDLLWKP